MKLKKIASLALAGVMAVSMLAGCKGNDSSSTPTTEEPTTETSIVKALNDGQDASNSAKIAFTDNSTLDAALKSALEEYGVNLSDQNVKDAAANLAGVEVKAAAYADYGTFADTTTTSSTYGLLNKTANYYYSANNISKAGGKTFTAVNVQKFTATNEEAALKAMANVVNGVAKNLPATSTLTNSTTETNGTAGTDANGHKLVTGEKYYAFSYTGYASVIAVEKAGGAADYYLVYTISQTVTEKTL